MGFMISHYKGVYRLLCPYDHNNEFPRDLQGRYDETDVYIPCANHIQINYYGKSILKIYIPSVIRGKNILEEIKETIGEDHIWKTDFTDKEVLIYIHSKYMPDLEPILKPFKRGASISPFSKRNLPKHHCIIPDKELSDYKHIIDNIPKKNVLTIVHTSKLFLKNLYPQQKKQEQILKEYQKSRMPIREFIYSIGKWDDYLTFLSEVVREFD